MRGGEGKGRRGEGGKGEGRRGQEGRGGDTLTCTANYTGLIP